MAISEFMGFVLDGCEALTHEEEQKYMDAATELGRRLDESYSLALTGIRAFIGERTVKNHLHNIFDKLGVSDRLELALYAIHNNLHTGR